MSSKNPAQRLQDILENIDAIQAFLGDADFQKFTNDRKTLHAVTRAIEIISEASRRLPEELKGRHPKIDWQAVAAAGNVYRHEYESVDEIQLWHTIQRELGDLREAVISELNR